MIEGEEKGEMCSTCWGKVLHFVWKMSWEK